MTTSKDRPTKVLDARGLLCPKPVMLTRDLVLNEEPAVCVVVDNEISATNVTRFLENASYKVTRRDREDCIEISAMLSAEGSVETMHEPLEERGTQGKSSALLMTSEYIGPHSDGLGELLMKSFLGTIAAADAPPAVIALMNGAVKLSLSSSSCSTTLKELEDRGVVVLVCGTCTKHFGVTDDVVVGRISNMFEITEGVFGADRPVVL